MDNYHQAFLDEQSYLAKVKSEQPELFVTNNNSSPQELLGLTGIKLPYTDLIPGVIKYHSLDFIVEEVLTGGKILDIAYEPFSLTGAPSPFIESTLVKAGISTFDAVKDLCQQLKVSETKITYGGVKDSRAVTAQRITFTGVKPEQLESHTTGHYFLKQLEYVPTAFSQGKIQGNQFTILVRTQEPLLEQHLTERLDDLQSHGFWNFYWTQRFGTRFLSHKWGLYILQNKPEKLLRSYFTDPGPNDAPYFNNLRKEANQHYGDWKYLYNLFKPLGFSMRYELIMLEYLMQYTNDFVGALRTIPEQVKFWTYAYASFLVNQKMSLYAAGAEEVPNTMPLLLSNNVKEREFYKTFLDHDQLPINFNTGRFDFIRMSPRQIETKIKPKIKSHRIISDGTIVQFELPKGAYATAFLSHIFTLVSPIQAPWLQSNIFDLKQSLGQEEISQDTFDHLSVLNQTEDSTDSEME